MPGVQSFVAQRQQGFQTPSRQILGLQNRVPVPRTNLENARGKPSFDRPNSFPPTNPPVAKQSVILSLKQPTKVSEIYSSFNTDTEDFEDTATVSIEGRGRPSQDEGLRPSYTTSYPEPGAISNNIPGARLSSRCWQGQLYRVPGSRQMEVEVSKEEDNEGTYGETSDAEEDAELDHYASVRDGILQDLNSPGFSQYVWGDTSCTNQADIQPVMTTLMTQSRLALRDVGQHSQRSGNPFRIIGNGIESGAAGPGVGLKSASSEAHDRVEKQTSEMSGQKAQGTSMEQLSISTRHDQLLDHHESSQLQTVTARQSLRPKGGAREVKALNLPPQTKEKRPLLTQKGSINLSNGDASADWVSDADRRHDRKHAAPVDSLQVLKRFRTLDYKPDELSRMTFQQLSDEPFNIPSASWSSILQNLHSSTLVAKMDYVLENLKDDHAKLEQRRAFFTSLSIEHYEECANLIMYRFSALMSKFTNARQQRRREARNFEEEVAKREDCVRGKHLIVDQNLVRLKRGGEEVVKGVS